VSITMDVPFCLEVIEQALSINENPEILNTDPVIQSTSEAFAKQLKKTISPSAWTARAADATTSS